MANKMQEWFESGLQQWDITRDAPTSASKFPAPRQKYFYVWLDAPSATWRRSRNLCNKRGDIDFDSYWKADSDAELYHFIGKGHRLLPACSGRPCWKARTSANRPRSACGYVTVNGAKMSKSKGTFIRRPPISSTWIRSACVTTTP